MGSSYRVLIVDDEEEVRNLLVSVLSKHGQICESAKDSLEALEKIKKNSFNAVVADIVMPQMDGITITKELIKVFPNLPIMIITGYTEEYSAESAIATGAREFIKKPFSLNEFIIRFDKMMRDHETLCKIKEKYNKTLFNEHRKSSEEIERLKREIKTMGGK